MEPALKQRVIGAVVSRMTEQTIAGFIARNAEAADSSINRVAQAFHTLVQDDDQRQRMIALAHDQAATSPFGSTEGFEDVWNAVFGFCLYELRSNNRN